MIAILLALILMQQPILPEATCVARRMDLESLLAWMQRGGDGLDLDLGNRGVWQCWWTIGEKNYVAWGQTPRLAARAALRMAMGYND